MSLTPEEHARFTDQQRLAKTGEALNQCTKCGAYRLDGKPPFLHLPECPHKGDLQLERYIAEFPFRKVYGE